MSNLLKSDFYKLFKTKSFFVCCIISVVLAVASVFILDADAKVSQQSVTAGVGGASANLSAAAMLPGSFSGNGTLFASIVISIIVASEFGFGTIKNIASRGFSRTKIYFSKLLVSSVAATVFVLAYSIAMTITATCLWGFGDTSGSFVPNTLKIFGLEILLNLAFTSVFVLVSSLIRQTGGSIAVNICIMNFFALFVQLAELLIKKVTGQTVNFLNYLISTNMNQVAGNPLTNDLVVRALLVGVIYLVGTTALGIWLFNKRDIK